MNSSFSLVESFNHAVPVAIALYASCSVCYLTYFSSSRSYSFPSLQSQSSGNTALVIFLVAYFICVTDLSKECYFSYDWFVSTFFTDSYLLISLLSIGCYLYVSKEFIKAKKILNFEYDLLVCFSALGLLLLNSSSNFLSFYLAIELQSLSFYTLAASDRSSEFCTEAAIKYFILGAFSSCLFLLSFSLLYTSVGGCSFEATERIAMAISDLTLFSGVSLFTVALLFKLGVWPFHMWLCDIYEGSRISVTAFFSTVPKVIIVAVLIRLLFTTFGDRAEEFDWLLKFSGLGSVAFASLAALYQKRIKRLLAYSAVSHSGYVVLAVSCFSFDSVIACTTYLTLYIVTALSFFAVLFLSGVNNSQKNYIISWTSVSDRNIAVAVALALALYSMAGIPPLSGFYSKLYVLLTLISSENNVLTVLVVVFSSISCFYYIRLVKVLLFTSSAGSNVFWFGAGTKGIELFVGLAASFIVLFFFNAETLMRLIIAMALSLS